MKRIAYLVLAGFVGSMAFSTIAEAGPLCGILRGAARVAAAPLQAVGAVRANRREARQYRRESRSGVVCAK